jgi:hypothetical protein
MATLWICLVLSRKPLIYFWGIQKMLPPFSISGVSGKGPGPALFSQNKSRSAQQKHAAGLWKPSNP